MEEPGRPKRDTADDLLRRALVDHEATVSVALKVRNLPLSEAVTVIFHGRRDLGTVQTYVTPGSHGTGTAVGADALLRVPCDIDLAEADDRTEAERLYTEQAAALRDALVGADTVLDIWREPLSELAATPIVIDRSVELDVSLPAHRLMPTALVAPDRHLVVTPVCTARTLAEGRPPVGIACAQPDVVRVYPLPEDPERCLSDFLDTAADHAWALAEQIAHQEASTQRFLELTGDEDPPPRAGRPPRAPE
jgi:hypothetical protein